MIYSAAASRQIEALRQHYDARDRVEAVVNLDAALVESEGRIERTPTAGFPAPRPYPNLAMPGRLWTKAGRYWVTYSLSDPPVILAVFHDAVDIPGRSRPAPKALPSTLSRPNDDTTTPA